MKLSLAILALAATVDARKSFRGTQDQPRFFGNVQTVHFEDYDRDLGARGGEIIGVVFEDTNQNSEHDDDEPGLEGVMVSDGINVVLTNSMGVYALPAPTDERTAAGFAVMVTVPDGYSAPMDEDYTPQFYYIHKPEGTPLNIRDEPFRYGGLEPTGPLPSRINFPMMKTASKKQFKMVVSGDPQTYSNDELGYLRDTTVLEVCDRDDIDLVLYEGDVLGDELSMYPRIRQLAGSVKVPQYYVAGNHDFDFDSPAFPHSFDTFKRMMGPDYYSFEVGDVHFVVLNNVRYPCLGEEDNLDGLHGFCNFPDRSDYNGVLSPNQMEWLKNDLSFVPKDKLLFVHMHVPIVSFIDQNLVKHNLDNVVDFYEAIGCKRDEETMIFKPEDCERPVLSTHAHTHTNENILPGESFEGWNVALNAGSLENRAPGPVPYHQIIVGASSGSWWSGDFDSSGIPESYQRLGAPRGYFIFEFDGNTYKETFKAHGKPVEKQMHVDILTPAMESWFRTLADWRSSNPGPEDIPPLNINDLPDTQIVVASEKSDSYLSVNVWLGSRNHVVEVEFDDMEPMEMVRTQEGNGENMLETLDPFSLKRQMMVARFAYVSNSTEPRANGYEQFRASYQCGSGGPSACTPRPMGGWTWTDQSTHVWQLAIPEELDIGTHTARVFVTDNYGREFHELIKFEIMEESPPKFFKTELWENFP